jgi:hypothetical protein
MTNSFTPLLGIYKLHCTGIGQSSRTNSSPSSKSSHNKHLECSPRSCDNIVPVMPSSNNISLDVPEHNENQSQDPGVMEMVLYHKIDQRNARRNKRGDGLASDMNIEC